jgi:hypothetical protein
MAAVNFLNSGIKGVVLKKLNIYVKIVICLGLVLLALSCTTAKKLQAASILKQCNFSFKKASIDDLKTDSLKFTVFLNAHNKSKDSLFAQNLNGMLYLDSLFEIPISLQKSTWLSPGYNELRFSGAIELDLFKLLSLPSVKKFTMKGIAFIALKPGQNAIEIEFNETKDIPPDLVEKQIKSFLSGSLLNNGLLKF